MSQVHNVTHVPVHSLLSRLGFLARCEAQIEMSWLVSARAGKRSRPVPLAGVDRRRRRKREMRSTRRVNNSGDISWHKDRVFISEVLRFEDLGFELVAEDFYKVFFRNLDIGEFDAEALRFRPVSVLSRT